MDLSATWLIKKALAKSLVVEFSRWAKKCILGQIAPALVPAVTLPLPLNSSSRSFKFTKFPFLPLSHSHTKLLLFLSIEKSQLFPKPMCFFVELH